jgi:hypothetical protein
VRTLVFIHGRGQQGRNAGDLTRLWCSGLNAGLTLAGMALVDPANVVFPFYGDVLHAKALEVTRDRVDIDLESIRRRPARVSIDPTMPADVARIETEILQSMAQAAGLETDEIERESLRDNILRIPGASQLASFLADVTDGEQELIERFLRDVAVYLEYARDDVQRGVRLAVRKTRGELVVVGHSLGAVVARELMEDASIRRRTAALVTTGSPLGIQGVYNNLATPGTHHPGVPEWLTVWDPGDFVALGHPVKGLYGDPIEELRVRNPSGHTHDIEHYLRHRRVAAWIGSRLA